LLSGDGYAKEPLVNPVVLKEKNFNTSLSDLFVVNAD
jgi:hypothetical protein